MLSEDIPYLPIIDHKGKSNVGLYKRKDLFEWLIKNPGKEIDSVPKDKFKRKALPVIDINSSFNETVSIINSNSAILVKTDGKFSHLISPRTVANALEKYSSGFRVFESLERLIRDKIIDNNIELTEIIDSASKKPLKSDPERLEFRHYSLIFEKKTKRNGLKSHR